MSILTALPGAALMPAGPPGPKGADSTVPGPQGEQGIQGEPGLQGVAGAGALISRTAAATVPAWTAIIAEGAGGCRPADPSNPAQRQQVIAVTAYGGASGAAVEGQNTGDLLGPNVGFVPGTTLFAGPGGGLTPTPPTSGWRQAVASVIADGHIVVNLGEATLIPASVPMIAMSGFAAPALAADVQQASATDRYLTPAGLAAVAAPGNPVGDAIAGRSAVARGSVLRAISTLVDGGVNRFQQAMISPDPDSAGSLAFWHEASAPRNGVLAALLLAHLQTNLALSASDASAKVAAVYDLAATLTSGT